MGQTVATNLYTDAPEARAAAHGIHREASMHLLLPQIQRTACVGPPQQQSANTDVIGHRPACVVAVAPSMSSRSVRSPSNPTKWLTKQMNGTLPGHYVHQQPLHHQWIRYWVRWLLPMLFVAVMSSYSTYMIIHQGPGVQHTRSAAGPAPAADMVHLLDLKDLEQGKMEQSWAAVAGAVDPAKQLQTAATAAAADAAGKAAPAVVAAAAQSAKAPQPQQSQHAQPAGAHPPLASTDAATQWAKAARRRMTVAIVNEAPYHLEIVAGFLHIFSQLPVEVTWYQAGQDVPGYSPVQLQEMQGFTQMLGYLPRMKPSNSTPDPVDFAVFISPEYFEKQTKAFLDAAKPITAVMLGHNGMNRAIQRLQTMHPRTHFAALAPHVAAAMRNVLHIHTHWMMATYPFMSHKPCSGDSPDAATCLHGFSIQGNFESQRRNYTRLWQQVSDGHAQGILPTQLPVRPLHLHLLGRGDVANLRMPADIKNDTTVHFNLRFPQYYDQIQHTHALLMLLGNKNYLIQKMSSTVVSSLMTATPIIADQAVLDSYTFLKPEHVFLMEKGETEMHVMQRVLRMTPAAVHSVKQKVAELAAHLNRRTIQVVQTFMPMPEDAAAAPAVV